MPKDYNALTDERVIQVSGNERAVSTCREEIQKVVEEIAPLLKIDLIEFKATKKVIEENFKKLIRQQQDKQKDTCVNAKKKKSLNETEEAM